MNALILLSVLALDAGVRPELREKFAVKPAQPTPEKSAGPTFIEDDYAAALKTAKAQKKVLLVDAWAPWCHSCIFMREHIFTRAEFKKFEDRVVFSSIDTEKTKSAPFLDKFPVSVWPTLFFIDPQTEKVTLKWIGSADENQMAALLESAGSKGALSTADAQMASGKLAVAAKTYLTVKDPSVRATLSTIAALSLAGMHEVCVKTVVDRLPELKSPVDRANAVSWGIGSLLEIPAAKRKPEQATALVTEAKALTANVEVLGDDASGLFEQLVDEASQRKDEAGAKALALEWLSFLEAAAKKATSPAARAVFDPHRVNAAIASGQPERAIDALNHSARDFPADYNPPARLALIYREMKKYPEALKAADSALALCLEGPRKVRLYENKASIQALTGDSAGRTATLKEALAYAEKLPAAQYSKEKLLRLQAELSVDTTRH